MFEDNYQVVAIATDKMEGGQAMFDEMKKGRSGGMPWMVILDGDGKELITSVGPEGNVGCPVQPAEVDYFVTMIESSSSSNEQRLEEIRKALTERKNN
ncbi:hypothetical protein N9B54_01215 [Mariniblastus sp.]|nr:hypothetical protein [Mariniblastus sp.]MDB4380573.1 hypothetical protein [Mariniblastus sp.]MDB4386220.1 hypothetical protein [bacterium]MDB4460256.1 hypothetical protein [bacterium]MDB4481280.1 hypothetical protein [bacterium]